MTEFPYRIEAISIPERPKYREKLERIPPGQSMFFNDKKFKRSGFVGTAAKFGIKIRTAIEEDGIRIFRVE